MFHSPEIAEKWFQVSDLLDHISAKTITLPHSRETEACGCWENVQNMLLALDKIEEGGKGEITIEYHFIPPFGNFSSTMTKESVEKDIGDALESVYGIRDFDDAMKKEYSIDPRKEKHKNKGGDVR